MVNSISGGLVVLVGASVGVSVGVGVGIGVHVGSRLVVDFSVELPVGLVVKGAKDDVVGEVESCTNTNSLLQRHLKTRDTLPSLSVTVASLSPSTPSST